MASTGTHDRERDGRSLGELTKQLTRDISALVRSEVMLAKVEVSARARVLAGGAAMLAVAVILGLTAFVCVVTAAVAALSLVWVAALIVAAVAAMVAAALALFGVRAVRSASPPLPVETMESAKEDVAWVKAHARQPGAK